MTKFTLVFLLIAAILIPAVFIFARDGDGEPEQTQTTAESGGTSAVEADVAEADEGEEEELVEEEPLPPPRWYRSNSAGMALEFFTSRLVALRHQYSLSVEIVRPGEMPEIVAPYFNEDYRVELRTLFKDGVVHRHQWIFRDERNVAMLIASGSFRFFANGEELQDSGGAEDGEERESEPFAGFIEFRNNDGSTELERVFNEDFSQWEYRFFFGDSILLRMETWFKAAPAPDPPPVAEASEEPAATDDIVAGAEVVAENGEDTLHEPDAAIAGADTAEEIPAEEVNISIDGFTPLFTDYYRYSRSGALRAIDRLYHGQPDDAPDRIAFPRGGPQFFADTEGGPSVFFTPQFIQSAIFIEEGSRVVFTLDNRGRVLTEVWRDAEDRISGELSNTWADDRILSVLWRAGEEERLVEYEYNDEGDRVTERNFRRGELERIITMQDGLEIEEIFRDGRAVLRAVWEDGLKISEERIAQSRGWR